MSLFPVYVVFSSFFFLLLDTYILGVTFLYNIILMYEWISNITLLMDSLWNMEIRKKGLYFFYNMSILPYKETFSLFLLYPLLTLWLQMTMARMSLCFIFQPPISESFSKMLLVTFPCPFGSILSESAEQGKYLIPPEALLESLLLWVLLHSLCVSSLVQFNVHIGLLRILLRQQSSLLPQVCGMNGREALGST